MTGLKFYKFQSVKHKENKKIREETPIHQFIHQPNNQSIYQWIHPFVHQFMYSNIYSSIQLCINQTIHPSLHLPIIQTCLFPFWLWGCWSLSYWYKLPVCHKSCRQAKLNNLKLKLNNLKTKSEFGYFEKQMFVVPSPYIDLCDTFQLKHC